MLIGIDAARWQNVLPVSTLLDAGIRFAIIKATHGLGANPDAEFLRSFKALKSFPIVRSAYHWLTDADPVKQAENYVRVVEAAGYDSNDLPLQVDFEEPSTQYRGARLGEHLLMCLRRVKALTGAAEWYSGRWYLDQFLALEDGDIVEELLTYDYWHAEYPRAEVRDRRACGIDPPNLPAPKLARMHSKRGLKPWLWQFDGNGGCVLPNGVDADFNRFDGSLADLVARCARRSRPMPADPTPTRRDTPSAIAAVREPIADYSVSDPATLLRPVEVERTPLHLREGEDDPTIEPLPDLTGGKQ